jgi:signal-transduction protein with cAMP-binding, CBS, and nucleotidyltransferase domain
MALMAKKMAKNRIRRLPVTEAEAILGVISSTDALNLAQKDLIIQQLEQYIAPGS